MKRIVVLGIFLLAVCSGCSTIMANKNANDFRKLNYDYHLRLRWLDIQGASRHLVPEHREAMQQLFREARDLKVTDLQRGEVQQDLEKGVAVARYRMEYYWLPSVRVQTFSWEQTWELVDETWKIVTPFPPLPEQTGDQGLETEN